MAEEEARERMGRPEHEHTPMIGRFSEGWNLIAAGPSRARLRTEHLLPNSPTVTVNRALDVVGQGIHVDFAAFADGPSSVWTTHSLYQFWSPAVQLWVSLRPCMEKVKPAGFENEVSLPGIPILRLWDRALPASVGLRVLPYGEVEDVHDPKCMRSAFTTLCAFRRIMEFRPKNIRILSMDMAGSWHEGMTEEQCHAFDMAKGLDRWAHERKAMELEMNRARSEGVRVETVIPT